MFYIEDPTNDGWHVIIETNPRDYFNMSVDESDDYDAVIDTYLHSNNGIPSFISLEKHNHEDDDE